LCRNQVLLGHSERGERRGKKGRRNGAGLAPTAATNGTITLELRSRIQSLSLPQLEDLSEALLDFSDTADLVAWLHHQEA
jgi:hypothetical protein